MAIRFYLEIAGKRYVLPVNPESIKMDIPSNNQSNEVVKLGEITQLAVNGLKSLSFDSFFPSQQGSYINEDGDTTAPQEMVDKIEKAMNDKKPVRIIVTGTSINMLASIDQFEWEIKDATNDYYYSITLKEYREYGAKYLKKVDQPQVKPVPKPAPRPAPTQVITVGCRVVVNGQLHRDSYGSGPGQTEVNATRIVNIIVGNPRPGQNYPYHVTTLNGGWRGWVSKSAVRRI
ncbi:hypothetical protein [Enterococcus cecorum]|uniref:hypothetical protein n=1 Tax=Enterococcus cecorum TaxID=44008 RepID=UPI0006435D0F|nr:hypothetical protein [Enterococcus cecorum]KLO70157.1 hypothetical protein AA988_07590 [Enterococcus cecorum]CAI3371989.1 hypothetical protein CIRMBP1316_00676 [Enterococcus cecorum]